MELKVVAEGVLIRPVTPRSSLAARLETYQPMPGELIEEMAWDPIGAEEVQELNKIADALKANALREWHKFRS
ncbi:hypothetical protein KBY58_04500 [Cyanobium sp. HWJ4-Hawea]|uniref:hypothetical protein n=1 Tax=Cyanobium sp. HWJ4-Hawea TaxID=2823713 RepID=UPI0020CCCCFC|nr:hypothetical protein [Cyanobium sp. HWJ4-Hawea]MCP9808690.1 hypothetical protein [Cyanobium sp. HWJ4-Hawea]